MRFIALIFTEIIIFIVYSATGYEDELPENNLNKYHFRGDANSSIDYGNNLEENEYRFRPLSERERARMGINSPDVQQDHSSKEEQPAMDLFNSMNPDQY